jgi:uncharacterized protein YbjT (DUF2867 family)
MILISGSPGNIGTPLAEQLVEQSEKIRLIVRDPKKPDPTLAKLQARGAEIVRGDFADPDSLAASFTGVSSAFLLTPVAQQTTEWKRNFIHAAKRKGVQRIVNLSVAGASATVPIDLFRWHWQAEQELESSGIAWTHLRPTDLSRYMVKAVLTTVQEQGLTFSTAGEGRVALVDEVDVAEVAAAALTKDGHEGKTYTLTGPAKLSYPEMADALAQKLGKPVKYVDVTPAQAKQAMVAAGLPEWVADFVNDLRAFEQRGEASDPTEDVQNVLGRPARPFRFSIDAVLG